MFTQYLKHKNGEREKQIQKEKDAAPYFKWRQLYGDHRRRVMGDCISCWLLTTRFLL
jgi:hypothetical protein